MPKSSNPLDRFDLASDSPKRRIIGRSYGDVGTGKTHFWLTAPAPIVVLSMDRGTEGVIEQFIDQGKEVRIVEYDWMTVDKTASDNNNELQDKAIEIRDQFIADHEVAVQHARTVIWDRETDIWELFRYAHLGKPNDDPKNYAPLNQMYRRLINLAKATDVNFGCIQGLKNEWGTRVNPNSGKKQGFATGKRIAHGFDELDGLVHVNLEHTRADGIMGVTVGKVRGPGAMKIQDQSFEGLTFPEFATQVFPDTSEGDWE